MTTIQSNNYRPPSPSPSQLPPVPASPTYSYASTAQHHLPPGGGGSSSSNLNMNMSAYSLPLPPPPPTVPHAVLTKSDLAASQQAYAELLTNAKSYRVALAALSTAASAFGSALEACARLKEARADSLALGVGVAANTKSVTASSGCTADALLAAAGVHHLVANHKQILSETVYRSFEVPLLHELDKWRRDVEDEEGRYLAAVKRQSQDIRRLEKEGMKLHRQKGPRDVAKFRGHLVELTTKLDGLTALHGEHARTLLRESQDTSVKIVESSCSLVRAEVDIFESLARKGWSGGGLEDILERGQDLFAPSEEEEGSFASSNIMGDDAKLFSILPPKSILADTTTLAGDLLAGPGAGAGMTEQQRSNHFARGTSPHYVHSGHKRADSLGVASEPYQSLTGAVTTTTTTNTTDIDAASIFSVDLAYSGRPRMTRPFSPQPIRVRPEDVMGGGDSSDEGDVNSSSHNNESSEDERASSPETIREEDVLMGSRRSSVDGDSIFRRVPRNLSLGGGGEGEDEDNDEQEDEHHPWGNGKRMSSAASDPEERERRWNTAGGSDTE